MNFNDNSNALKRFQRLKQQAKPANEECEKEKVHCPECGTTVWKNSIEDAVEAAEKHDRRRHDGETKTKVNGITPPSFSQDEKEQVQNAVQMLKMNDEL